MKKLIFSALAVVAIVSTSLTLSARENDILFCTDATHPNDCVVLTNFVSLENQNLGRRLDLKCAEQETIACPAIPVFVGQ